MAKLFAVLLISMFALGLQGCASAHAADFPALPDGGSLVTSAGGTLPGDGGGPWITIDTGQTKDWLMSIRCRSGAGSPRVYYRLSTDAGTARTADQVVDVDRTFDIPVPQGNTDKYRFLSLLGEDGGPPACTIHTQTPN